MPNREQRGPDQAEAVDTGTGVETAQPKGAEISNMEGARKSFKERGRERRERAKKKGGSLFSKIGGFFKSVAGKISGAAETTADYAFSAPDVAAAAKTATVDAAVGGYKATTEAGVAAVGATRDAAVGGYKATTEAGVAAWESVSEGTRSVYEQGTQKVGEAIEVGTDVWNGAVDKFNAKIDQIQTDMEARAEAQREEERKQELEDLFATKQSLLKQVEAIEGRMESLEAAA